MRALYGLAMIAMLLVLAVPSGLDSCANPGPSPVFTAKRRPADLSEFAKGKIGVVQPSMRPIYMIGAYRALSGVPLSDREAAALYPVKKPSMVSTPGQDATSSPVDLWLKARLRVPGIARIDYLRADRTRSTPDSLVSYINCLDDAFASAKRTLEARAKLWGDRSANVKAWLTAQDQVFSNCGGEHAASPPTPDPGMDPLLAADRRYQIAAALFYAGEWERARQAFDEIAMDESSPWAGIAPYLSARTFIREALVDGSREAFDAAEERLTAILRDVSRPDWHEPSRRMLELVRGRRDPHAHVKRLSNQLLQRDGVGDLGAVAEDFIYLLGHGDSSENPEGDDELVRWMTTMAMWSPGEAPISYWQKTGNPAWLVAALRWSDEKQAAPLVRAARETAPGSPAYESAVYYGIEREILSGHKDQARAWADDVLSHNLVLSTRNLIRGQRTKLARNWTEFLRFAPRRPEPHMVSFDGVEEETALPAAGAQSIFDTDSIDLLNSMAPLSLWIDAANYRLLPAHLQLQIAEAGWIRSVLLGKNSEAQALMERVVRLKPSYATAAKPFLIAADAGEARFTAALILMRGPWLTPYLQGGDTAPDMIATSTLGGGRWCFTGAVPHDPSGSPLPEPDFLTPAQKAEAAAERKALYDIAGSGANYLAAQVIARARSHPDDPRVPEALHFAVQTTRRGCGNQETGKYSKQAFDLLHSRYPRSPWTAQTPYWYN